MITSGAVLDAGFIQRRWRQAYANDARASLIMKKEKGKRNYMIDFNRVPVECSCGRTTTLVMIETLVSEENPLGAYKAQDLAWEYRPERGWYCGLEGHKMHKLAGLTAGDYLNAVLEATERGEAIKGN